MLTRLCNPQIDAAIYQIVSTAREAARCDLAYLHLHGGASLAGRISMAVASKVRELVQSMTPQTHYVQASPNLRIHCPGDPPTTAYHSDTAYGHSKHETNYWLTLTPVSASNSLWLAPDAETEQLHRALRGGASLAEFERQAHALSAPIESESPGLWTFCCSHIHGSVANATATTRVSFDIRTIPSDAPMGVKRRGSYFQPQWLRRSACPLTAGMPATTVASLDVGCPVMYQRTAMRSFYPQSGHRELVEFIGLNHAPTLEDAMGHGPVVCYSVRQFKAAPKLTHPIGLADERAWFVPGEEDLLNRLRLETQG